MTEARRQTGEGGRGRAAAVALSVAVHVVLLALLAWNTPALRMPVARWAADVQLELAPRLAATAGRTVAAAASAPSFRPRPQVSPIAPPRYLPAPAAPPRPRLSPPPLPAPAAAPAGAPAAATPPGRGSAPTPGRGSEGGAGDAEGDVRGAVRAAIGCAHEDFLRLSPAERAACERKMAEAPKSQGATVDPIPPLKRGAFDRRAAYDERCKRYATPVGRPSSDSVNRRPTFDEAPPAVRPSGPAPPGPWLFCGQ